MTEREEEQRAGKASLQGARVRMFGTVRYAGHVSPGHVPERRGDGSDVGGPSRAGHPSQACAAPEWPAKIEEISASGMPGLYASSTPTLRPISVHACASNRG